MALVALVPLFFYAEGKTPREGFVGGFVAGFIWTCGTVYWIAWPTIPGFIGTLLIVPLYTAIFLWIFVILRNLWGDKALWLTPFLWTTLEYLSSTGPFAFPWNLLSYTQCYRLEPIQMACITGTWGISFWVVLIDVFFYFIARDISFRRVRLWFILVTALVFAGPWIYGHSQLKTVEKDQEKVRIAMVQGNVDPQLKWTPAFKDSNFAIYRNLTETSRPFKPDLVVWPETATACYLTHLRYSRYMRSVRAQIKDMGAPLLTGSPDYRFFQGGHLARYNSALLIHTDPFQVYRYHKMALVPFSERVPFVDYLPFLLKVGDYFKLGMGNFTPGDSIAVFPLKTRSKGTETRFSSLICYDSVFPDLFRRAVEKGAEFFVVITNDGWFGNTSGPYQHAQISVLRAIENRRWIARCANTGISLCIDPKGRITGETALNEPAVLNCEVGVRNNLTFFVRHGTLLKNILLCITFCLLSIGLAQHYIMKKRLKQLINDA